MLVIYKHVIDKKSFLLFLKIILFLFRKILQIIQ